MNIPRMNRRSEHISIMGWNARSCHQVPSEEMVIPKDCLKTCSSERTLYERNTSFSVKGAKPRLVPENLDALPLLHTIQNWPFGLNILLREIFLWWEFVRYDLSSTVFPGILFGLAAWRTISMHITLFGFLLTVG